MGALHQNLEQREEEILTKTVRLLVEELHPPRIYLFGSRGKGQAKLGSDFDIAVDQAAPDERKVRTLKESIEGFSGLYSVDVVFLPNVKSKFRELILETGKIIYDERTGIRA